MKDLKVEGELLCEALMFRQQLDDPMMVCVCVHVISVLGRRLNRVVITTLIYKTHNLSCSVLS